MQGAIAIVSKRNIRRTGIPATVRGQPNPAISGPTLERLSSAGDNFTIGGDERTGRRYVMQDNPLDRAFRKGVISGAQHSALTKYRHHWYHAGQSPHVGSVDLDRIFSAEGGNVAGMPVSERQVFHRQRWREGRIEIGDRISIVVDKLVCEERSLEDCGYQLGWRSKPQAIAAATEMLQQAGYRLAKLWGIG
jgi:hypothetical protein